MKTIKLKQFSKHLFWDTDLNLLDVDKNKKFIIHRVLDYGLINDWKEIKDYYGIAEIAKNAVEIKDLDKKSAAFISVLSGIPIKEFSCYTTTQLTQKHWNF